MVVRIEKNNVHPLIQIDSFLSKLDKLQSKHDIALALLSTLNPLLSAQFSSFVERTGDNLKIVCQFGNLASAHIIQRIFKKEMCERLFDWAIDQERLASLRLLEKELFVFLPITDYDQTNKIVHGIVVFHIEDSNFEFTKEINIAVNVLNKLVAQSLTKLKKKIYSEKYNALKEQIRSELKLASKLQKSISQPMTNNKFLFDLVEDKQSSFNGNVCWLSNLGKDINLVLIAQAAPSQGFTLARNILSVSMLVGYVLGEMNSFKVESEHSLILLKPQDVLQYLNQQLHPIFRQTGISITAWYGVFNISTRKVRFANANHPDPFLIGPEQQVINLSSDKIEKGQSLGISLSSTYLESTSYISTGSKLVICTQDLLEHASKIGNKFDPTWLPQVLETLGNLSLSEMKRSLESILSENGDGTAYKRSRLALLLEIPS